ncbi:MAG: polysaccharide deacetylase [Lachnospiraceae bacterium]|nr:polysaccharide deacetylase [Lachnospiraceae bacterium]
MSKRSEKIIRILIPAGLALMCAVMALLGGKVINLEKRIRGYEAVEQLGERQSRLVQLSWIEENAYEASDISELAARDYTDGASSLAYPCDEYEAHPTGNTALYDRNGVTYAADSDSDGIHRVYLTFDDGPSIYTDDILDILAAYDVKATFFVVGRENTASYARYLRIIEEGHTLGMHSYSHVYSDIYASPESFAADTERIRSLLEDVTGYSPVFYRFPGGSSNDVSATDMHELEDYLSSQGIVYFDWNVSSGDAGKTPLSPDQIINNALQGIESRDTTVILFHDTAAKRSTVYALPSIIEAIQSMDNTVILPITYDTTVIQHDHP